MAREAFLINPPRRIRKKARKSTKGKHRITVYETGPRTYTRSAKSPSKRKGIKVNPYGEEVIVVGNNPRRRRRKRKSTSKRRRRNYAVARRSTRSNPVRRKRRTYRRKRRSNPVARRRTRRNPVRRYRRRSNPMALAGGLNFKKPMTLIMPVSTGIVSLLITKKVPQMLNLSGNMKYAAQLGVAVIGSIALAKPIGKQNAMIFGVVSLTATVGEILSDKVGGVFSGLDAFVDDYSAPNGYMGMGGQFTSSEQFGAFVDDEEDSDDPYGDM